MRILKLEDLVESVLANVEVMDRLSREEKVFLSKLSQLNNFHFDDVILSRLQEDLHGLFENADDRLKDSQPLIHVSFHATFDLIN